MKHSRISSERSHSPSRKHSQQKRKDMDASPYINHSIALVSILAVEADINDWDTLCAALLHDSVSIVASRGQWTGSSSHDPGPGGSKRSSDTFSVRFIGVPLAMGILALARQQ